MSEQRSGIRGLPPALTLAFAIWFVMSGARLILFLSTKEPWGAIRFTLVAEGATFASEVLAMLGTFALARRLDGREALGARIVALGFAAALAVDVSYGALGFVNEPWRHEWLFAAYEYAFFVTWLALPVGLAIACWQRKRELAIFAVVISLVSWPPPVLRDALFGWLPDGNVGWITHWTLWMVRLGAFFAAFIAIARGSGDGDRAVAAGGLRTASFALWLRVIATVSVVMVTLLLVVGKGGRGSFDVLRLAMMASAIISVVAFVQFGVGAARTAREEVAGLARWPIVVGGAASLWACGVALRQLPFLYNTLYRDGDSGFSGRSAQEMAQALSVATPVVVTIGVTLLGTAIAGFAAKRGDEDLRAHAQAKTASFVVLTLVALAIQQWIIPTAMRSESVGTFAVLSLLAAGAALAGTVMMAKLLGRGAEALEAEPGLPKASVARSGTRSP